MTLKFQRTSTDSSPLYFNNPSSILVLDLLEHHNYKTRHSTSSSTLSLMVSQPYAPKYLLSLLPTCPFALLPMRAFGIHQHEQLFVFRYLLHSSVQTRPECMFMSGILCFGRGIRHKNVTALARPHNSSSVTFKHQSLINSGGYSARVMEVLTAIPTPPCPFFPTFPLPHSSPLQCTK